MDIDKLIKKGIKSSNKALSESDLKLFLKEYQISVITLPSYKEKP